MKIVDRYQIIFTLITRFVTDLGNPSGLPDMLLKIDPWIHSQMNLHMCAKFGVNRNPASSVAVPEFVLS